jgi:putative transposase
VEWGGIVKEKYMHYSQSEKYEIIRLVEGSDLGVIRTLWQLKINKSTFYSWYNQYLRYGYDGLAKKKVQRNTSWNRIHDADRDKVVEIALEKPELSSRELAWHITDNYHYYISESSVYRILKANGLITTPAFRIMSASDSFYDRTTAINQMWQTDFTYFKILSWGWYYLSTILDDYSRYIIHWELCSTMKADDVMITVEKAMQLTGLTEKNAPKLLSDNGSCYISKDLAEYLYDQNIRHIKGRPLHPQTQGKIERYHRSMKNVVKLDNYFSPGQLKLKMTEFVHYYNNERYHESLQNLTPADVYFGRAARILKHRKIVKLKTLNDRKNLNQKIHLAL